MIIEFILTFLPFLAVPFAIVYGVGMYRWNKRVTWRLEPKVSRWIKAVHYAGLALWIAVLVMYFNYDICLRGLWTTRSILVLALLTGTVFIFIGNKAAMNQAERWYFRLFSFMPLVTATVSFIPFVGFVVVFSLWVQLTAPADRIFYEDDRLRIQKKTTGVLVPPWLDIYEKHTLYEKHLIKRSINGINVDSVTVHYDSDSTRVLLHWQEKLYGEEPTNEIDTICLKSIIL